MGAAAIVTAEDLRGRNAMAKKVDDKFFEHVQDLLNRYEPLRPELHSHLEETSSGHFFIRHPFCNQMVHDLERCALIHHTIDERTTKADACFEAQDWEGYVNCIEVCMQPEWFAKDAALLPDDRYWSLLGQIYWCQKKTHDRHELFNELFRADRPGREHLMEPGEREVLVKLPDVLTVYRGYTDDDFEGYADGIAWTLDRRAAVWYANWVRESENPRVITGKFRKEDVWAYSHGGDLLLPPEDVFEKRDRYAWNQKARQAWGGFIKKPFDVSKLFTT